MTLTSSSTEHKLRRLPLFTFQLRQNWTLMLFCAVADFFMLPVPLLMMVSERASRRYSYNSEMSPLDFLKNDILDWSSVMRMYVVPITAFAALMVCTLLFRYMMNKSSVDCFHSIPVRRERLLTGQLAVGLILVFLPLLVMMLVSAIIILASGAMTADTAFNILMALKDTLFYTLLVYSLTALIGAASGVSAVQAILTGIALFILPALYASTVVFLELFTERMWTDYYLSSYWIKMMSPPLRFFIDYDISLTLGECVAYTLVSAALFTAAYLVYRFRKSERAGESVVFRPLGEVIRFTLVYLMTILGGLFFNLMMGNIFWTFFGMICGAFLTSMIVNTILHKTARAMFRNMKALLIYLAIITVIVIGLYISAACGLDTNVPAPGFTSHTEVVLGEGTGLFDFDDRETVRALYQLYNDSLEMDPDDIWHTPVTLQFVFHPFIGFPVAKSVTVWNFSALSGSEEVRSLLKTVADDPDFSKQYREMLTDARDKMTDRTRLYDASLLDKSGKLIAVDGYYNSDYRDDYDQLINALFDSLIADAENLSYDWFQSPIIGYLRFQSTDKVLQDYSTLVPLYADHAPDLSLLSGTDFDFHKLAEAAAGLIDEIVVTDQTNGKTKIFTNKSDLFDILTSVLSFSTENRFDMSAVTAAEARYLVEFKYEVWSELKEYQYGRSITTNFLKDRVPACVTKALP